MRNFDEIGLERFAQRLSKIIPVIRAEFVKRQKNIITRGIISLPQMTILEFLYKNNKCIMGDIADLLSVSMSAATGLVSRMIKSGMIKRAHSEDDRRIVEISITKKGKRVAKSISQQQYKMIKEIFGRLSRQDREKYLEIAEKVHNVLKAVKR